MSTEYPPRRERCQKWGGAVGRRRPGGRTIRGLLTILSICAGLLWAPQVVRAQVPDGNKLVQADIVCPVEVIEPGQTVYLGIRLRVEPGWHVYWKNAGDTGMPVRFKFEKLEGVSFDEILWPTPTWYLSPGDILDHIHEGEPVFLVPMTIDESFEPGDTIEIECRVDWLVCKDLCVPGGADVSKKIKVGAVAKESKDKSVIDGASQRIPVEIGPGTDNVRINWSGEMLIVKCPGAKRITLFPHQSQFTNPEGSYSFRTTTSDTLRVPYEPKPEQYMTVSGVLLVERGGKSESYEFQLDGPSW